MERYYQAYELMGAAYQAIKPVNSVLDIGCGIRPFSNIYANIHICCEPYGEYVELLKRQHPSKVILNMTWQQVVDYIPKQSVDTVLLLDVIEHLEKEESMQLLLQTMPLVKQQLIIFTPLGFFEQYHDDGIDAWGLHGGSWQTHRSGWMPADFPDLPGGKWEFYICERFHGTTAKGVPLPEPKGAFWAIWNVG